MEHKVRFTVTYEATVKVGDGPDEYEFLEDAVCDIDIPENDQCKYVANSMEVERDDNLDPIFYNEDEDEEEDDNA